MVPGACTSAYGLGTGNLMGTWKGLEPPEWLKRQRDGKYRGEKPPFPSPGTGTLLSCQRASRQEVDTSPDVSNYKKYKQTVGQTRDGEITQARGKKRLLVCSLKLQRQKQEAIPYPKTTTTTVEASR